MIIPLRVLTRWLPHLCNLALVFNVLFLFDRYFFRSFTRAIELSSQYWPVFFANFHQSAIFQDVSWFGQVEDIVFIILLIIVVFKKLPALHSKTTKISTGITTSTREAQSVTQAELAEIDLRAHALTLISSGVLILDATSDNYTIIDCNKAFEAMTGYDLAYLTRHSYHILSGRDTDPITIARIERAHHTGSRLHTSIVQYHKNGEPFWSDLVVEPIYDTNARIMYIIWIQTDITQQKNLEAQYLHLQKVESVEQLTSGIVHDFNNMLTVITGNIHLAHSFLEESHPLNKELDEILKATNRATRLTKRLLTFIGKQEVQPCVLNLNDILQEISKPMQRLIGEDIVISTQLAPQLGNIYADQGQIEQVLINLIINARDAMPKGGHITLETANAVLGNNHGLAVDVKQGAYVALTVSDTGAGISPEAQQHVLEPFFTTKPAGHGTGLGLPIILAIVTRHGGTLHIESKVGQGTKICIYLPQIVDELPDAHEQTWLDTAQGGAETVLLVEDDANVRLLLARMLQQQGHTVLEAASGDEALLVAQATHHIDLMLTDMIMPSLNGVELAAELACLFPHLKCVFMSGYPKQTILAHCGPLPPHARVLQKPFSSEALSHHIRATLDAPAL